MNKFFNRNEFKYALDALRKNPWDCIKRFQEYFEKYPNDYTSYPYYAAALITVRELDDAELLLKQLNDMVNSDINFQKESKYNEHFQINVFFSYLKLYLYQERYIDAYNLFVNNPQFLSEDCYDILLYCKAKLGLISEKERKTKTYIYQQIMDYNEEAALNHIKLHEALYNENQEKKEDAIFDKNFPLRELLPKIKKYLESDNDCRLYSGYFNNTILFQYDNCGSLNGKNVNFFQVVFFHGTTNIITMYPTNNSTLPYIDLNTLKYEKEIVKSRQIDKFYRRYQRKEQ